MPGKALICAAVAALCAWASASIAQAPLSAIDWLSDVSTTPLPVTPEPPKPIEEEAVTRGVISETIMVTPLDAPSVDAVGLLPLTVSGLPADLWGPTRSDVLIRQLGQISSQDLLPATRELLFTLLLAELDAPLGGAPQGAFLKARVDALTRLGAVEQAHAILERAGIDTEERFTTWFDLSILLGRETSACERLTANASLTQSLPVRIFCLARGGDWAAAALSFETARIFGQLTKDEEALLLRFLQTDLDDSATPLRRPSKPSALVFHLFEAIGEPLSTTTLPVAFAHADLRSNTGWKAQIEAAERLTSVGALPANRLLGLYTERQPAASGGVWERVEALQNLDQALVSSDATAIGLALPRLWGEMQAVELETAIADLYSDRLRLFPMTGRAGSLAFRMGLLTEDYEATAQSHNPGSDLDAFLVGLATGQLDDLAPPNEPAAAIAEAFAATAPPQRFARNIKDRAIGSALLHAIRLMGSGQQGDLGKVTEALALFRSLGLETVARRAALELLILDRRG